MTPCSGVTILCWISQPGRHMFAILLGIFLLILYFYPLIRQKVQYELEAINHIKHLDEIILVDLYKQARKIDHLNRLPTRQRREEAKALISACLDFEQWIRTCYLTTTEKERAPELRLHLHYNRVSP